MPRVAHQSSLLDSGPLFEGFRFKAELITPHEELALPERIRSLEFREMRMRGGAVAGAPARARDAGEASPARRRTIVRAAGCDRLSERPELD